MDDRMTTAIGAFLASIVSLAALSVILGSSQTSGILSSFGTAISNIINAATSPARGGSSSTSTNPLSSLTSGLPGSGSLSGLPF